MPQKLNRGNRNKSSRFRGKRPYKGKSNHPKSDAPENTRGAVMSSGFSLKTMPFFGYKIRKSLPCYIAGTGLTCGASTATAYVISANGMYDPDITGTGPQPMSFDQAMTFFNHYTVHNAFIKVVFQTNSTTLRASVGLFVSGSSTATTSIQQLIENGDGAFQILEFAGAFGGMATFTRRINLGRFQAVPNVMNDPNMRGDNGSNPAEQAYFHLVVWNAATSAAVSVDFQACITYDATFHEPRKGSVSLSHVEDEKSIAGDSSSMDGVVVERPSFPVVLARPPNICNHRGCRFVGNLSRLCGHTS